jgi:hypothetical protein
VLSNEMLVMLDVVSALGYEVVFCRLAGLRAVGCLSVSDNQLVNELCECRVGSTESRLGVQSRRCNFYVLHLPPDYGRVGLGLQECLDKLER